MDLSFRIENANYAFGKYDRVHIEGSPWTVGPRNEEGYVMTLDDSRGLSRSFSHDQLSRLGGLGRIHVERNFFLPDEAKRRLRGSTTLISGLDGRPHARVSKKDAFCEGFLELERDRKVNRTDESIKVNLKLIRGMALDYAENLNRFGSNQIDHSVDFTKLPSPRTLRRWLSAKAEFGLPGLIDGMARRGNRTKLMSPEAYGLMMKEVRGYLSLEKPSIKLTHENVLIAFHDRNEERVAEGREPLTAPSYETVRRAIRNLDPFTVEIARNGEAAARKKFRPVINGLELTRLLQRVEMDEWTVDAISIMESAEIDGLLTEEEKKSLGLDGAKARWTLTAVICCTSRCILAMVLSRNPGGEAAVQALQMVVSNKGLWADATGSLSSWDMHGTPELLVTDGGLAFKSERFRFACADLGIAAEIAINGTPELRGMIERVFGTMATDLAARMPGRTFSNIREKGDADPEKRAAMKLEDVTFAFIRWVVDIYHNTPHRSLDGETPIECWRRLSKKYGVQSPPDMHHSRLVFGQRQKYNLEKTGITVLGVRYQSEALATWMRRKDPHKVDVRWHPKDIGAISVKMGPDWFEIPAVDSSLEGVAAQTWLTAVRNVRAASPASNRVDMVAVREAIKAIASRNAKAMSAASLNLEDWSGDAADRAEARVIAGVEFFERKAPKQTAGKVGRELPDAIDAQSADPAAGPSSSTDATQNAPAPKVASATASPSLKVEED